MKIKGTYISKNTKLIISHDTLELRTKDFNFTKYSKYKSDTIEKIDDLLELINTTGDKNEIIRLEKQINRLDNSINKYDKEYYQTVDDIKLKYNRLGFIEEIIIIYKTKKYKIKIDNCFNDNTIFDQILCK